jgi:hypothetical protein
MQTVKGFSIMMVMFFCLGGALSGTAMGQDEQKDISSYSCKDVMRMSGTDRELVLAVLHAFILGKKGTTKFDVPKLTNATDEFIEFCLDNPNDNALAVMEKLTK